MVKTRDEVLALAQEYVDNANRFFSIKEAYLFGSYAAGNAKTESDIDIALVSEDFVTIPNYETLKFLSRLSFSISTLIEPVVLTPEEINRPKLCTVSYEVKQKGIRIEPKPPYIK
jgi:predicted nucleotidyltransferase